MRKSKRKRCKLCLVNFGSRVETHHLEDKSNNPKLAKVESNLVDLCYHHHRDTKMKWLTVGYHDWNGGNKNRATRKSFLKYADYVASKQVLISRVVIGIIFVMVLIYKYYLFVIR